VLSKGGVSYTYPVSGPGSVRPHAVTSLSSGWTYQYDANGNVTQRVEGGTTYAQEFDAENRLERVTVGGQVSEFSYDGDGNRVKKVAGGQTTVYVGSYYEKQGTTVTTYYYVSGQRVAMRQGGVVYYLHTDHLGSTSLTTNASGGVVAEQRYYPYGGERWASGTLPTDRRFTGQRWEQGLGLYDYNARWYHPALGRFVSADTIVPEPGNPQSLNRYSYSYNNPVLYVDNNGHFPIIPVFIGLGVATVIWLAYAPPVYAPDENWTPPPEAVDRNYGDKAFLDAAPGTGDLSDAWAMLTGRSLFTGEPQNRLAAGLFTLLPVASCGMVKHIDEAGDAVRATGQWHHMLSNKIIRALDKHETLHNMFKRNDLVVPAFDKASHRGYQTWHRLYDNEVVEWLAKNPGATREEFLEYLGDIYGRPEMRKSFPSGLDTLLAASEESQ
jgi:RHS repeat-associated protein